MLIDAILPIKDKNEQRAAAHWISATKAISWRVVGTIDTWIISYIVTGKWQLAFSIASIEVFSKVILYYFHERAWEKVRVRTDQKVR